MALIEKDIADELVALRQQVALGHHYVPAVDLDRALQRHLEREQWWRAEMHAQTDGETTEGDANRTGRSGA